jgi:hypothetical protein
MLLKIEVLKKHPEIYDFLGVAYLEEASEVKGELEIRNKKLMATGQAKLYEDIDTSKFKEGVDVKKAIEIITWTVDGFINKETQIMKNISLAEVNQYEMLKELEVYLEMLKKSFYK